jgi:AraC-like DNA-binding protein
MRLCDEPLIVVVIANGVRDGPVCVSTARNIKKWRTRPGYDHVAMPSTWDLLQVVREIRHRRQAGATLDQLAARAGWSPFHLHRAFRAVIRETPKQYALRLQLQKAAARLVSSEQSILDIAIAVGFNSHEVFTRAFRRIGGRRCIGRFPLRSKVKRQRSKVRLKGQV